MDPDSPHSNHHPGTDTDAIPDSSISPRPWPSSSAALLLLKGSQHLPGVGGGTQLQVVQLWPVEFQVDPGVHLPPKPRVSKVPEFLPSKTSRKCTFFLAFFWDFWTNSTQKKIKTSFSTLACSAGGFFLPVGGTPRGERAVYRGCVKNWRNRKYCQVFLDLLAQTSKFSTLFLKKF